MAPNQSIGSLTPDDLVARLSWRPDFILNSMISIPEPIKSTGFSGSPVSSSIGSLDTLPTELLHKIFNSLDFRSLSRFLRVCHRAKIVIELLPSYLRIMKHASTTLAALTRTELITYHTAATLHAALLAEKCVCCQKYGAYLFLPTCERCCYQCLHKDNYLRVISVSMAKTCYAISEEDLQQIPIMLNIPGRYSVGQVSTCRRQVRLVSLKQAKTLGLSIHGSQEVMHSLVATEINWPAVWLANPDADFPLDNIYAGMASIPFPSLRPNGDLEGGLCCGGCKVYFEDHYLHGALERKIYTDIFLSGTWTTNEHMEMVQEARSRSEFLAHIKDCEGAKILFEDPARL